MSTYDDLIAEGETLGVDADYLARLKAAADASPLRAENKTLKEQRDADAATLAAFRDDTLAANFKAAGIAVDHKALNLPADLDIRNVEAIKAYGMTVGLVAPATTPEQDKAAIDALAAGHNGAPVVVANDRTGVNSLADLTAKVQANSGWTNTAAPAGAWR